MEVALAVGALALRLAFFALAAVSIVCALRRKGALGTVAALAAGAALAMSSAASAADPTRLIPLGLVLAALTATAAALRGLLGKSPSVAAMISYLILLISMGMCLVMDAHVASGQAVLPGMARYSAIVCIGLVGLVGMAALVRRNVSLLSGNALKFFALGVALLSITLIAGSEANGAKSWLTLGSTTFQPSELAKVALVIAGAGYLAANASRLSQFSLRGIVPIALGFGICLGVIALQKDLGWALVMFLTLCAMMTNSTKNGWVYLLLLTLAGIALVAIAYSSFAHVQTRFDIWLNPLADPYGAGYQHLAATACMANGGIIGCGLGNGLMFENLPVVESDYIYALLCEELGLAGCGIALACYVGIAWESARCASTLPRASFERNAIAAAGILISCQAALIVGGVVNLIPLTGITLPLVSRGGSSLVSTTLTAGLLLGASCSAKAGKPARLIAPHVMALGLSLLLGACLATTAKAQIDANGGLILCGTTKHQNLSGSIVTSDGAVLARSASKPDSSESDATAPTTSSLAIREYPQDSMACHVLGQLSNGLEANIDLKGSNAAANLLALPETGDDLQLTIDSTVQATAEEQLEGCTGAIVAIDPETGRVLAMASAPTYSTALHGTTSVNVQEESFFNRATLGQYSPGSTFKLVTLAAALENGIACASTSFDAPGSLKFYGGTVTNCESTDFGQISLTQATNSSVNTAFAQLGESLGEDALISTAESFGFNADIPFDLETQSSTIDGLGSPFQLAWAACGEPQGGATLAVTPLQMALCMCAIANEGTIMQPYLIESRVSASGKFYDEAQPSVLNQAVSAETANKVRAILQENETAIDERPYRLWGKTGTAENEGTQSNAWYIGAAEHEGRTVVVACVIEQGGSGSSAAKPRAAAVAAAALDKLGE